MTGVQDGQTQRSRVSVFVGTPEIKSFEVLGSGTITEGRTATLSWEVEGVETLTISPAPGDVTDLTEAMVTPSDTTVYTLTATNDIGSSTAEVTVTVVEPGTGSLIAHFDFEEGTGPTTTDSVDASRIGTLGPGASWSTDEFAPSGSSASIFFDGTDSANVVVGGWKAEEIGDTNPRTIALWIKSSPAVTPETSNLGFLSYGENQAGDKFNFRTQQNNGPIDGNIRVEINGGFIIGTTVVVDGDWHHVAMTWEDDGTPNVEDVLLYVDGELEEISASLDEELHTDTINGWDFTISDDHSQREWNGWLDDIQVFDFVLGPDQIKELMMGTSTPLAITDIEVADGSVTITWNSRPNRSYSVDTSASLEADSWFEVEDSILSGGETTSFTTNDVDPGGNAYFRVREE